MCLFLVHSDYLSMSTNQQIKNGTPETNDLLNICTQVTSNWVVLAKVLGFREVELDQLTADHGDGFEQCYQMLLRWKQKCGSQASYDVLAKALQHPVVNQQDLAFQYCYN